MLLGYIPSPHEGSVHIGPVVLHLYGLTLLVAICAAIWLTGRRWLAQGGDWDLVLRVAVWGVGFGVWGGVFLGTLAGAVVVRRSGASVKLFMDAIAPGLLLAQGIGRIGNWWNQELFGKPTTLPWGLKIDPAHRPLQYLNNATFHPTFLYELIWDVLGALLLIWIGKRFKIRPPALFALYVAYYTFGRFFEELLRVDPSHHVAGLRLNAWVSIIVFVVSVAYFVKRQFRSRDDDGPAAPGRTVPAGPKMAIPKSRVR